VVGERREFGLEGGLYLLRVFSLRESLVGILVGADHGIPACFVFRNRRQGIRLCADAWAQLAAVVSMRELGDHLPFELVERWA
jgi:hypothetical protein